MRRRRLSAGEPAPGLVERGIGGAIGRHMPDRRPGELLQPEIGARGQPRHLHVLLDQRDERQEQRAVESVLVELVRRHVGGRHHDHAEFEQPREQPAEDHRVGNVGDVEFVEAQKPSLVRDRGGREPDRIVVGDLAGLELLRGSTCTRSCTSAMNSWKCARRLRTTGEAAKNMSISMVLPRPTSPKM